jgi:hypothetical protein
MLILPKKDVVSESQRDGVDSTLLRGLSVNWYPRLISVQAFPISTDGCAEAPTTRRKV